ncbi:MULTISPECIES: hypothetical protein [Parabacteroides]|uniref:hypothetical protein n=1 Tax=Parabacteroides timonensis TaxID=1871013 RepID=UPI00094EC0A4|nr:MULTISPECIES: hypothetical protein [Parabacteroides]
MKDTIITASRKRSELLAFLVCFIIANLVNIYSIYTFKTSWAELVTSIGFVTICSVVLYVIWAIIRLVFFSVKRISKR